MTVTFQNNLSIDKLDIRQESSSNSDVRKLDLKAEICRNSFDYAIENNGMLSEECYNEGDEDDLAIGLINYGRVGAGIDISASYFKQYRSDQKKEFWDIQNSLGISWDENGLMQLARHSQDRCGISSYSFAAVV
ncbi:MAG: hypothetical protein EZS28_017660 [Streblomastix strix]|uniref:Peptidase C1A papain C-terminal domain-containing protein n=1 Tax=Streblomastix strix TaxID=222440 RepID=A0A5J4VWD7_9EUKA|nr:MAG: hypothetical protein EZS28_017660 [Streblomastix strix]